MYFENVIIVAIGQTSTDGTYNSFDDYSFHYIFRRELDCVLRTIVTEPYLVVDVWILCVGHEKIS